MAVPIKYNLRYLRQRWGGTLITMSIFGLVVGVFVMVMAMVQGITKSLTTAGNPMNLLVMREGAMAEGLSVVQRDKALVIQDLDGVGRGEDGKPLASPEFLTLVNLKRAGTGVESNLQLRGVSPPAFAIRPEIKITQGRNFEIGMREAIVGKAASARFDGMKLGDTVHLGPADWKIVGLFEAGESAFNSEVWMDCRELMQEFKREQYSTVLLRATDKAAVGSIKKLVADDKRIQLLAKTEEEYYKEQTTSAGPLIAFGSFLAVFMSIGACFAGMNTMYAAVAGRSREIGTLRILGFTPTSILLSFMFESIALAILGGMLGCAVAGGLLAILGRAPVGTVNMLSFSEVIFYFKLTPELATMGMLFALAMGVLGGLLPAISASRRPILSAMRQV